MIPTETRQLWAQQMVAIAKNAGSFIRNHQISQITEKGGAANLVTDIDVKCQQLIVAECRKLLPDSCILAEEGNDKQLGDGFTWIIDPIDGTTNYLYGYRHSCISIALYAQRRGVVGVVYNPYLDECFVGIEGVGSSCNGQPIRVNSYPLENALVMTGTSPLRQNPGGQDLRHHEGAVSAQPGHPAQRKRRAGSVLSGQRADRRLL